MLLLFSVMLVLILTISLPNEDKHSAKALSSKQKMSYALDNGRFIAHAGGQIDGHNYTNSLDSLNLSYKNGFKKFELDIRKTSDGHFVATHDWKMWKKLTGYTGNIPPNVSDFLKTKILNKYTPMDIKAINQWFMTHPDAILITDKVRNVRSFTKLFIDNDRLIMEVFDWENLQFAQKIGIKSVMPTGNLLKKYQGDVVEYLKKNNVTEVALSRNFIVSEKQLVTELNSANIKIYAFHLNDKEGKGTNYVICNESHYFYGFYADIWHNKWQPNCSKNPIIEK